MSHFHFRRIFMNGRIFFKFLSPETSLVLLPAGVYGGCRPMSAIHSSFVSLIIIIVPVGCVPNMITDRPTEQRRVLKFLFGQQNAHRACINNSFRFPSCLTPRRIVLNDVFLLLSLTLSRIEMYYDVLSINRDKMFHKKSFARVGAPATMKRKMNISKQFLST